MSTRWKRFLDQPYPFLMLIRSATMVCVASASIYKPEQNLTFSLITIGLFIICYICLHFIHKSKWIFFMIELISSLLFGYYFLAGDFPYHLLVGLVGLGLFLYYEGEKVYISWSLLFVSMVIVDLLCQFHSFAESFILYSFIVFASVAGVLIRYAYQMKNHSVQLYQKLETSYQQLQEHSQKIEQLSIQEERNRIAREIHDTVGHTVTALIVQLEAAQKLLSKDQQKSAEMMKTSEELARSIYQAIRFSIEANYQDEWVYKDIQVLFQQLINDFSRHTGLWVSCQTIGNIPQWLSHQYKFGLYRALQETLTNAKRHGSAHQVEIKVTFSEHKIHLYIEDDGIGTDQLQLGFGLKNLQKRIRNLAGECNFSSQKGKGFRTEIMLPLHIREEDR